jgi:23S rRNA (uracil747-C5)-methyltransferase
VVSVNLLPEHAALVEGEREIVLTEADALDCGPYRVLPRSFVQTNTAVAESLYAQAGAWVAEFAPARVWDLYCGTGRFALAVSAPSVLGVELNADAVASASRAAGPGARFVVADAAEWVGAQTELADLVILNPPRRGIGEQLARWLAGSGIQRLLYSSCNAETLARDLAAMPTYRPVRAQVFDMFPHTRHYEVLTLLSLRCRPAGRVAGLSDRAYGVPLSGLRSDRQEGGGVHLSAPVRIRGEYLPAEPAQCASTIFTCPRRGVFWGCPSVCAARKA